MCGAFVRRGLPSRSSLRYNESMKQPKNVTPPTDAASAFLREVDEAMHQERLLAIWHRSKWFILAAVIGLVLAVAGLELAGDSGEPQWLRDIARLNAALALMDQDAPAAKAQLELLAQSNYDDMHGPAYAPALELLALLSQQAGDVAAAKGYTLKLLQVPGLPADLRQRAMQRVGVLGGAPVSQ